MNRDKKFICAKAFLISLIALSMLMSFCACGQTEDRVYPSSLEELNGLRSAHSQGAYTIELCETYFPDSERLVFRSYVDVYEAIKSNKADYALNDSSVANIVVQEMPELKVIDADMLTEKFGLVFSKDPSSDPLREEIDAWLEENKANGFLDELSDKWRKQSIQDISAIDLSDIYLSGENGTLNFVTDGDSMPYSFYANNQLKGLTVELVYRFAAAKGYDLNVSITDFSGIIASVVSGKADFGGSTHAITEERKKSVNFSIPFATETVVAMVANPDAPGTINGFKKSFRRTFIEEDRWMMILNGFAATCEIVLSAVVFGTALGFAFYLLYRKGSRIIENVLNGLTWLFGALPTLVLLMILYYIIFGDSQTDGVIVAAIAFSVFMSLTVFSLLKSAVDTINKDQLEGALSMGCTDIQAFMNVILPQAMSQFIPNYLDEVINMVKSTAIVGYIAVPDLTKVSDIIRSRTFEAFMPIMFTAIIYILIILLFTSLLMFIAKKTEPKKRSAEKVLKKYLP